MPADAFALVFVFSFALSLSLPGSYSCRLRLGLVLRLRLGFRLGLRDDLGVVAVDIRTLSSARLAVAVGEARIFFLRGVRHHEGDVRAAVLVNLGDFTSWRSVLIFSTSARYASFRNWRFFPDMPYMNLSSSKPEHITGGSRRGARRGGGADSGRTVYQQNCSP